MTSVLKDSIPADQLLVVHANLGDVEWDGVVGHIEATIGALPLVVCRNERRGFFEMVADRGMFPSPQQRQCTSDFKRNPIERTVGQFLKANPRYGGLVVDCMGLRAEESSSRASRPALCLNAGNSLAGREWYDWLPIHGMKLAEVWETIRAVGQQPHTAYARGMSRLSCRFCIMASDSDLRTAAEHSPALFARYVALERSTGRAMMMPRGGVPRGLEEITGITVDMSLLPDNDDRRQSDAA